jgi:hypothetical protein
MEAPFAGFAMILDAGDQAAYIGQACDAARFLLEEFNVGTTIVASGKTQMRCDKSNTMVFSME